MQAQLETRTVRETHLSSTLRRPALVWGMIVAYLAAVTLLVSTVLPVDFVDRSQAGFFEPQGFAAMVVFGSIGVFLSTRTGFPDPIGPETSPRRRFVVPILIGIGRRHPVPDHRRGDRPVPAERRNLRSAVD